MISTAHGHRTSTIDLRARRRTRSRGAANDNPKLHAVDAPPEEHEPDAPETDAFAAEAAQVEVDIGEEAHVPDVVGPAADLGDEAAEVEADHEPAAGSVVEVPASGASASDTGLSDYSTIGAYLHELRRYPLMTREEEHETAVKFCTTADSKLACRLITANLRLVVKIAQEYRRAHRNVLDLIQEGNIGLIHAVQKYDPYRGVKLS